MEELDQILNFLNPEFLKELEQRESDFKNIQKVEENEQNTCNEEEGCLMCGS